MRIAKFRIGHTFGNQTGAMLIDHLGNVFYTGRHYDIREEKAEVRRAFCRLTGMKNKDLDKAMKTYKHEQSLKYKNRDVECLKEEAERLGFDLVEKTK